MLTFALWMCTVLVSALVKESVCAVHSAKRESFFVPGIHDEEMGNPIRYNAYVPIIFEFKLPNVNEMDMIGTEAENCTSNSTKSGFACPAAYYLNPITGNVTMNLYPDPVSSFSSSTLESSSSQSVTESLVDSFSCEQISSHFKTSTSVPMNVDNYVLYLTNTCSFLRETLIHQVLTASTLPTTNPLYTQTLSSFQEAYTSHIKWIDNLTAEALQANLYATMQGIYLTNLVIEKNRWDSAISSCTRNALPPTLVDQATLQKALKKVITMISVLDYELAIPHEDLFQLYTAKLTDCTFTDNMSYIVRLLVPVKQSVIDSFTLYKLNSIPSFYKTPFGHKKCEINNLPKMLAYKSEAGPGNGITENVLRARCQDNLCFVPLRKDGNDDYPPSDYPFYCAQALMTNIHKEVILKFCKDQIRCSSFAFDTGPYYHHISSDSLFYRQVDDDLPPGINISVICSGTVVESFGLNATLSEFILTIGCDCHIKQNMQTIFSASRPCKDVSYSKILSLRQLTLSDDVIEPRVVLPNVTLRMLDDLSERMKNLELQLQAETEKSKSLVNNHSTFVLLVILLTVVVCFLGIWVFQLWRWKKENLFRRSAYNPVFDQSSLIQEDAAL